MKSKILSLVIIAFLLTACNPLKSVFKHTDSAKTEVRVIKDSVITSNESIVDKSIVISTKTTSGQLVTPERRISVSFDLRDLIKGQEMSIDSSWFKMVQVFDSVTNRINTTITRPKDTVNILISEEIKEYRDLTGSKLTSFQSSSDSLYSSKTKIQVVEKQPLKSLPYIIAGLVILVLGFAYYKLFGK